MEYDYFLEHLADNLPENLKQYTSFADWLRTEANLDEYADHLVMTMPSPRLDYYSYPDVDDITSGIVQHVNSFIQLLGFYPVQAQLPILKDMQLFSMAVLFFSLVFRIIITIFIIISILLIYSLLMVGIDQKTFEIGILRMVGISKIGLILMIFLQSIMFVAPAILLGFIISIPCLAVCYSMIFQQKLSEGFTPIPSGMAFLSAFSVGIFIPLLSAIIPVMRVLGQNLNDALNYERNRVKSIYIEILNKNKTNVVPQLLFGIISVGYGFAIYYLLPLSMLSLDLGMIL